MKNFKELFKVIKFLFYLFQLVFTNKSTKDSYDKVI